MPCRIFASLFDFDFKTANPAGDKIINDGHDDAANKSHYAVDNRHENAESKHYPAHKYRRGTRTVLSVLSERSDSARQRKEGQKDKAHTAVKDAHHFARL